jgi:hypothetical protein
VFIYHNKKMTTESDFKLLDATKNGDIRGVTIAINNGATCFGKAFNFACRINNEKLAVFIADQAKKAGLTSIGDPHSTIRNEEHIKLMKNIAKESGISYGAF